MKYVIMIHSTRSLGATPPPNTSPPTRNCPPTYANGSTPTSSR
ncbi:hypothetical protein V2I01_37600 [Micromonospora sp. BRA006-A]|nr:hypothetical protein [Micromonospora sp. BRA006-A]